jgi:hypothetical protein
MLSLKLSVSASEPSWPEDRLLPVFPPPAAVLDCIDLSSLSGAEADLFASLQGIVNRAQPRIVCVSQGDGEGKFTWVDLHGLRYRVINGYEAILKYRTALAGLVVTDPSQPHTLNLATVMAGVNEELICDPSLLPKLAQKPFNLRPIDDLRQRFTEPQAVYRLLYSNYWNKCSHRMIAGMDPHDHGFLRDYLVALKVATIWLNPGREADARLLRGFVSDLPAVRGIYLGWWPDEGSGLQWIARYGIPVLASDFLRNATVFCAVPREVHPADIPPLPRLENKVYVAFILSDGDNIQYMQHFMKLDWQSQARGAVPIGWTVSPLAVDLDPGMLSYYWNTATGNDCLISGPSGAGYAHVQEWSRTNLSAFARLTDSYLRRSGLRIITVWDRVNDNIAQTFAAKCPTLLGLTDQSGTYHKTDNGLRTIALTPTYTSSIGELLAGITNAAAGWNGAKPMFIIGQADVWNVGPTGLVKAARELDPGRYRLVRPDQLFLLCHAGGD